MTEIFDSEEDDVSEVESLVLGEGDELLDEEIVNSESRQYIEACSNGDLEQVRRLLEEGKNVNEMTEEGESLLSLACSSGYLELAQLLLATRANVEDRGLKDTTPLMEAASTGNLAIVQLLLDHGADVNAQTTQGNTPLMYAASNCGPGSDEIVRLLLDHGANVSDCNENGHTPLMEAASAGNVGVAKILVESGASINTHSNEFKESALTLACYKGHLEMVRFLLEAGADQEHKTEEMHTALMEASMDGHVAVARLLLDSGAQVNMPADSFESPLTLAACGGHVELAMLLLERGANIEEVNDEGYTPLMEASREGHEEMVALLLSQGADINGQTEETQETALTLACCGGFLEVADFLIKAGADIESGANTPLAEASQEGHIDLVRHLIEAGANIHATSATGDTPLMYAAENGHTDVVQVLLESGASIEHEAEGGRTPLMKASRAGHLCTVQFLVSRGANVNKVTTNNDHTPLSLACAGGHMAVVEYLLANGADSTHRLKDNSTMLIEAAKGGHAQVVQLLIEHPSRSSPTPPVLNSVGNDQAGGGGGGPPPPPPPPPLMPLPPSSASSQPQQQQPASATRTSAASGIVNPLSSDNDNMNMPPATTTTQHAPPPLPPVSGGHNQQQQRMLPSHVNTEQLIENAIQWSKQRKAGIKKPKLPDPSNPDSSSSIDPKKSSSSAVQLDKKAAMDGVARLIKSLESSTLAGVTSTPPDAQIQQQQQPSTQVTSSQKSDQQTAGVIVGQQTTSTTQQQQEGPSEADRALKETERLEQCINNMMKRTEMLNPSREEQILQKQQILEELQRVEKELQEKAQQQLLLSAAAAASAAAASSSSPQSASIPSDGTTIVPPPPFSLTNNPDGTGANWSLSDIAALRRNYLIDAGLDPNCPSPSASDIIEASLRSGPQLADGTSSVVPTTVGNQVRKSAKKAKKKGTSSSSAMSTAASAAGLLESLTDSVERMNLKNSSEVALAIASHPQQQEILNQLAASLNQVKNQQQQQQQQSSSVGKNDGPSSFRPVLEAAGIVSPNNQQQQQQILIPPAPFTFDPSSSSNTTASMTFPSDVPPEAVAGLEAARQFLQTTTQSTQTLSSGSSITGTINSDSKSLTLTLAATSAAGSGCQESTMNATTPMLELTNQKLQIIKNQLAASVNSMDNVNSSVSSALMSWTASLSASTLSGHQPQSALTDQDMESQLEAFQATLQGQEMTDEQKARIKEQIQKMNQSAQMFGNNFDPIVPRGQVKHAGSSNVASQTLPTDSNVLFNAADSTTGNTVGPGSLYDHPSKAQRMVPNAGGGTISSSSSCSAVSNTNSSNTTSSSVPSPPPFFSHSIEIDGQTDSNHDTALTLSCAGGHDELVSLLLSRGANCEHRDKKGFTPLMLAATAGHANVCEILLNHGVDIEAQSERTKDTALSLACSSGRYEVVELLLSRGANKEHRNVSDYTPLSLAASGGYVNIIKLLLNHGAEINSRTGSKLGISPLMLAAMNGHAATVKLLLDMGSDINAQIETNRNTALTLACFQGRCEVVSLLLDRKANVEHRAKTGLTPLMEAASGGYVEVGRILLDKGADVNAPPVPSSRDTALTIAADKGHYRFVELLIKRGGQALNLDARNKKGSSPLWLAANGGHLDVVQLLVNSGADIDAQDNRKVSCLMSAFRKGHIKVVKWMVKHVTQFPSDQEMTRTLALVNDKEMLKKCNQCMEIIRLAKEKQAAEANKNATILLEELESERIRAENKKAKLASKREKKKAKKKEKKGGSNKDGSITANGSTKSGANANATSKAGGKKDGKKMDNDSSSDGSDDDDDDEDPSSSYDDHLVMSHDGTISSSINDTTFKPENFIPQNILREVTVTTSNKKPSVVSSNQQKRSAIEITAINTSTASPSKDSKKSKPGAVQVVEVSTTTITPVNVSKTTPSKSANQQRKSSVPNVTIEPVTIVEQTSKSNKKVEQQAVSKQSKSTASTTSSTAAKKSQPSRQTTPPGQQQQHSSSKHSYASTDVPRVPTPSSPASKSTSQRGHHSSSHVTSSSNKYDSESEWPIGHFDSVGTWGNTSSAPSAVGGGGAGTSNEWKPVKQTAAGWKEVTRRSKKVAVPSTAISRVIGRGGCNINAVREISGAHIEVEKQKGQQADRQILIKGTQDATRNAQLMINALVNEPDKDLNQIIASLGLSKPIDSGNDGGHFMTSDSSVFERIPSAGFSSSIATPVGGVTSSSTTSSSRSKVTSSSSLSSSAAAAIKKESLTSSGKMGVFNAASVAASMALTSQSTSSSSSTTSGVVRTNKPIASATTPAFTSTWANKSQSPRPSGIVASSGSIGSKNSSSTIVPIEKPQSSSSPFGSASSKAPNFGPKSPPSNVGVPSGSSSPPPSATYTPFTDTFGKVTSSVWGSSKQEKVNFANIVKGSLTSSSGEILGHGQGSPSSSGAIHVHPSTSPDPINMTTDQSKAPGFRGPNYASPGISSSTAAHQQNVGLGSYSNFQQQQQSSSGHRSAPCTPPLVPIVGSQHHQSQQQSNVVQQMSPESRPVQESSPQLRSTSSNAAADHFGQLYQSSAAPYSPGGSKNFSLAPGSRPQLSSQSQSSSYGQYGVQQPSYTMMDTGRGGSPIIDESAGGLNPNAPSYAPDSPAGQAQAARMLAHTSNLLRTASMQQSSGMSAPGLHHQQQQQQQAGQQMRPFDGMSNPQLQMQMRAAILAAGASLQMQAQQQQQQQRFMAGSHHVQQQQQVPPVVPQMMSQQQQQQMSYNSLSGQGQPDFAPASAETLRLLHTALLNTNSSSMATTGHTSSGYGQQQVAGQQVQRSAVGVIGGGRKISSGVSGTMSMSAESNNVDVDTTTSGDNNSSSSPENNSKSVPRPIGTERAQKITNKNPYSNTSVVHGGIIGSTNFGTTTSNDHLWNMDMMSGSVNHGSGANAMMMSNDDWMMSGQGQQQVPSMDHQSSFMSSLLSLSYNNPSLGNVGRGPYIDPTFGADPLLGAAMNGAAAGMMGGVGGQQQQQQLLGGLGHHHHGLGNVGLTGGQFGQQVGGVDATIDYWTGKLAATSSAPVSGYNHDNVNTSNNTNTTNATTGPTSNTSWYNHY